jgi:Protein of unknown function (DUF2865)
MMVVGAVCLAGAITFAPRMASAENLLDLLFGGFLKQQQKAAPQPDFFANPFGQQQPAPPPRPHASAGSGPAFCVRSCDGRYFPLTTRGGAMPAQMCQAFCPASATKVFFGSTIDGASSANGERYADSANAYAYRKALRADCTCNGRDPAGLAPVDLTFDPSLHPGDVIATAGGLVAYSGSKSGASQTAEFTPIASYPGLTAEVRARLGEMKVAPVSAQTVASEAPLPVANPDVALPPIAAPKTTSPHDKRAEVD